jgi:hypothetical protein
MPTATRLLLAGFAALAGAAALNLSLAADLRLRPCDVVNVPRGDVARVLGRPRRLEARPPGRARSNARHSLGTWRTVRPSSSPAFT